MVGGGWWVVGCAVGPDCALSFESVAPVSAIFWRLDSAVFSGLGTCGLASTSTPTSTRQALGRRKEQKHRMQSPPRQICSLSFALRRKNAHPTYSTRR